MDERTEENILNANPGSPGIVHPVMITPANPKQKEQQLAEEFIAAYKKLCEEHGFTINVTPTWKQSLDTGDWRLVLQTSVQKLQR